MLDHTEARQIRRDMPGQPIQADLVCFCQRAGERHDETLSGRDAPTMVTAGRTHESGSNETAEPGNQGILDRLSNRGVDLLGQLIGVVQVGEQLVQVEVIDGTSQDVVGL